jgi:hypothetical protein
VGFEHAADAPTAHPVALRLHFRAQPAGAVTLAVVCKRLAHGHFPGRLGGRHLLAALPGIVRGRDHPQGLAELAHGHPRRALGDVAVGAHGVGWPSLCIKQALPKAFF